MTRLVTTSPETAQFTDRDISRPSGAAAVDGGLSGVTVTETKEVDGVTHVGFTSDDPLPEGVTLESLRERQATQGRSGA